MHSDFEHKVPEYNIFSNISTNASLIEKNIKDLTSSKLPSRTETTLQQNSAPTLDKSKMEQCKSTELRNGSLFAIGSLAAVTGSGGVVVTLPLFILGGMGGLAVGSLLKLSGNQEFKNADDRDDIWHKLRLYGWNCCLRHRIKSHGISFWCRIKK